MWSLPNNNPIQSLPHQLSLMRNSPLWIWLMNVGLLLIMLGTAMPLLNPDSTAFRYVYTAGAVIATACRFITPGYQGKLLRVKRLARIEIWACIMFCVAAFFMWYPQGRPNDWLAFTLAGGVLIIYTAFMIPRALRKAAEKQSK